MSWDDFNHLETLNAWVQRAQGRLLAIPVALLISRTAGGVCSHDATQRAAGVAYYALLSIFPLLLGIIAIFGLFLPSVNLQDDLLIYVGTIIPGTSVLLKQNIINILVLRGAVGALSIVFLFWSASSMFGAISLAINRAFEIRRHRRFYVRKASELFMALSTSILFLLSIGASTIISVLRGLVRLPAANLKIAEMGSRLVAFLLLLAVFLLLYKLIPNTKTYWRYVWPGALLAAILFEVARTIFIYYLENFGNFQFIYGSIASIIVFLIWIHLSAFIVILGAEFTFQYGLLRNPETA
jgi:membrane protein